MRLAPILVACVLAIGSGCVAKAGQDPFAYTKKPIYAGGFDLDDLQGPDHQEFRVEDGSIGAVRVHVWVNATAGGARADIQDPSGRTVLSTMEEAQEDLPLKLGVWRVTVTPSPDVPSAGHVGVLALRG